MTFDRARRLVEYWRDLGVSDLYLSPILAAREGSTHGYDAIDPLRIESALGGETGLRALADALHRAGMRLIVDIVPNHLAADPENPYFDDVLRRGRASPYAAWFDIDWDAGPAPGRLLLPVLGDPLEKVLERGELELVLHEGELRLRYFDRSYPLDPATIPDGLPVPSRGAHRSPALNRRTEETLRRFTAGASGRGRLRRLLEAQAYRLEHWRPGRHRLNYRRFFDVNELIALRAEDPAVRRATHRALFEAMRRGWIDALRVDHVDGLLDPTAYLRWLRQAMPKRRAGKAPAIWVEKILAGDERLRHDWPVEGTTGYEFIRELEATWHDPEGAARVADAWARRTGLPRGFERVALVAKRHALRDLLRADLHRIAAAAAQGEKAGRPRDALERAIVEAIARLPVYRVYPKADGRLTRHEGRRLEAALDAAHRAGVAPRAALERLGRLLLPRASASPRSVAPGFAQRFQQLSGPAAAKGIEDTALYVYTPLLSRNEVGGEPEADLRDAVATWHRACQERRRHWPATLLPATTHDTKRSADVRARLAVLSELPDSWDAALARWSRLNRDLRRRVAGEPAPDAQTELLLYQTLVGVWPCPEPEAPARDLPARQRAVLSERVEAYMAKAMREAKRRTSWIDPDAAYEDAVQGFVRALLRGSSRSARAFRRDLANFVREVARPGLWNALARTLVQGTAPGIPDLYQGEELWSFSLVDPDNRRPVDFERRRRLVARIRRFERAPSDRRRSLLRACARRPERERTKLLVLRAVLRARRAEGPLFGAGDYVPLRARGDKAEHVLAFARVFRNRTALVVTPRLVRTLTGDPARPPVGPAVWGDTFLVPPGGRRAGGLRCAFSGALLNVTRTQEGIAMSRLLADFPVGLWIG